MIAVWLFSMELSIAENNKFASITVVVNALHSSKVILNHQVCDYFQFVHSTQVLALFLRDFLYSLNVSSAQMSPSGDAVTLQAVPVDFCFALVNL